MSLVTPYILLAVLVLALTYVVLKHLLYPALLSPLKKVPAAHVSAPWTPLWIMQKRLLGGENETLLRAHHRLGEIVRIGPCEVSVNCLEGLKAIYIGNLDKHSWFNTFAVNGVTNAVSSLDSKTHAESRRLFTNVYSKSFLQTSIEVRDMFEDLILNSLKPVFQGAADRRQPIDMMKLPCGIGYDFASRFIFGTKGATKILRDMALHENVLTAHDVMRPYFMILGELTTPIELVAKLGIELIPSAVQESFAGRAAHVANMYKAAEANPGSHAFVYDRAFHAFDKSRISCSKEAKLVSELADQAFAGLETSGSAIIYMSYELSRNTQIQDRLRAELMTVEVDGSIPDARELDSLPLLDAIIQETLRRYPPAPTGLPRVVPHGGIQLCGYSIPQGTRISCNAYSLHHNDKVFPAPKTWNPDRWLKSDPEQVKEMKRWFWAFGSGARMCLGLHFALQELKYVIAAMYTDFRTSIVEAGDMTLLDGFTGRPVGEKFVIKLEHISENGMLV